MGVYSGLGLVGIVEVVRLVWEYIQDYDWWV